MAKNVGSEGSFTTKDYQDPQHAPLIDPAELIQWSLYREFIAEFIATLLFFYITVLTVIGYKSRSDPAKNADPCSGVGILGIAWSFGGMIFILVYCTADPIYEASFFSVKITHGGAMKHKPSRYYIGGKVDYIDYVNETELKLSEFKYMAELCGYQRDTVTFWHKCGRNGNRMRLVSTDVEAIVVSKNIPDERVVEVYFEHLDSYIGRDVKEIEDGGQRTRHVDEVVVSEQDKEASSDHSSSDDGFEDSENDLADDNDILETNTNIKHRYEVSEEVQKKMTAEDGDSDCVISDDTRSLESDSDNDNFNFPKFNPITDAEKPVLALELIFGNKNEFKYAVITHEVNQGRYIKWCKNDKLRVRAICSNSDCKWEILASRMHRDRAFQIKTYNPDHTCKNWNHRNKSITSSYLAQRYLKAISSNKSWPISEFRDHVSVELRVHVTLSQCRRAKKKALALINGDLNAQYMVLWNYCNEIGRTNPYTSVYMKLVENEVPNKPKRFQRIYVCFNGCKEGFKSGCRKIIGVDGCWLKGPMYGTQLLTAVGIDPNNNIFPIAYSVVEKERKESWEWFLNYLKLDLNIDDDGTWTFMSDKQKGLIEAFNEVLPYVSHRFCVRHLHSNFKRAGFSGISLRNALWKAARATTVKWFNDCMDEIIELDSEAANWLKNKSPTEWSRSHFPETVKCDVLLNNMCECFNSMIVDARDKPIITLLEKLRYLFMARMQANRDKATKWNVGDICPRIKDVLHKNQAAAAEFIPRKSNEWNYEIIGATIMDNWAVDLLNRKCSCRKWDLTGIPCKHAIAAIWAKHDDINSYVDDCYRVETYRRIYEFSVLPMNGQEMWPKSNNIPPLPPRLKRQSTKGRKQTLRRKEPDEVGASRTKMKRKQKSLDCSICHNPGHNKRTCKLNLVQPDCYGDETSHQESSFFPASFAPTKLPVRRGSTSQDRAQASQESRVTLDASFM